MRILRAGSFLEVGFVHGPALAIVLLAGVWNLKSSDRGLSRTVAATRTDWQQFRGPNGSGVGEGRNLPIYFGPAKNVVWKTSLPAGVSSPVLAGDRLIVTTSEGSNRFVICLNRHSGSELWRKNFEAVHRAHRHPLNDPASPSPLTDGTNTYAFFPDFGLVSLDDMGNVRWSVRLGPFTSLHGICSSPILADGKIVLLIDQAKDSYVAAFDKENGRLSWKTPRPDAAGGYSSPLRYRPKGQAPQIIVSSPRELVGYSVQTGEKLWWVEQMGFQPQTSPILDKDTVYANVLGGSEYWENTEDFDAMDKNHDGQITPNEFPESYGTIAGSLLDGNGDGVLTPTEWKAFGQRIRGGGPSALVAVRLGGRGDLTKRGVAWRVTKALPGISSPLIYGNVLYLVRGGGIVTALDPASGNLLKQTRLNGALDDYFSSPVAAEDKIFFVSLSGKITVLKAGVSLEVLAVNDLNEECYASPAIGPHEIYIRTRNALYAFRAGGI